jgi:Protein of unknown function (DUF2589)
MTEGERNIQQSAGTPPQATDGGQVGQHTGASAGEVGIPDGAQMAAAGEAVGGAVAAVVQAAPGGAAALTAPNFATELGNIDFQKMIGGPLQAAVDAQVASSLATINFINAVGFTAPDAGGKRELVMVDFTHTRKDVDADGKATTKDVALKVPLLAMLPIPSLRIEQVVIDFNVKLNSVESSSVSDDLNVKADLAIGWGPVNFKVSASYQRKTTTNVEVKREYALAVNVKAVQDEIPAGLEKVLGMLAA